MISNELLAEIKAHMAVTNEILKRQEEVLAEHMRRSEANEAAVDLLEKHLTTVQIRLEKHISRVEIVMGIAAAIATAALAAAIKILVA